jgi:hypothetical protein
MTLAHFRFALHALISVLLVGAIAQSVALAPIGRRFLAETSRVAAPIAAGIAHATIGVVEGTP